jgi:hypothetical protein
MATMSKASSRTLDQPDEQVEKGGVTIDVVYLGDIKVKRANYPAGWKFSEKMGCGPLRRHARRLRDRRIDAGPNGRRNGDLHERGRRLHGSRGARRLE